MLFQTEQSSLFRCNECHGLKARGTRWLGRATRRLLWTRPQAELWMLGAELGLATEAQHVMWKMRPMVTFFRRIRQKLLEEGNLRRYLIYAVGEILLVVIGILIALQINNWNEGRKNKLEEQKTLIVLNQEFQSNLKQLDNKIADCEESIESDSLLLTYMSCFGSA